MFNFFEDLDLQLFAEGGDAGEGTAESGFATTEGSNEGEVAVPEADLAGEFDELIKGKYKDVYGQKVKSVVESRLKNAKDSQSQLEKLTPVLQTLGDKYGISDISDTEAILRAMAEDNSYYEDAALEAGMSVEDYKNVKRVERENKELHRQLEEQRQQEETDRIYNEWIRQSEDMKKVYPDFNLDIEINNEDFKRLLLAGVPVETAFTVCHKDEIIPAAMQYTAKTVEQKVVNSIANNSSRPSENLGGSQAASTTQRDVSSLTDAERDDFIKRARHGERITFR